MTIEELEETIRRDYCSRKDVAYRLNLVSGSVDTLLRNEKLRYVQTPIGRLYSRRDVEAIMRERGMTNE
jgi:hypothetical protein